MIYRYSEIIADKELPTDDAYRFLYVVHEVTITGGRILRSRSVFRYLSQ